MNVVDEEVLDLRPTKSVKNAPFVPRASGLYKDCMRQLVLCTQFEVPLVSWVDYSLKIVFEIGNAVHFWAQNTPVIFGKNRYGFWECLSCGSVSTFGTAPSRCNKCGANKKAISYKEYSLSMTTPYYITGHPDLFRKGENGQFHVVEIKTIDGNLFDSLVAPNIEHSWQVHAYMWSCARTKLESNIKVSPNLGYITYISKTRKVKELPTKTFKVKYDAHIMNTIKKKLREYKIGIEGGELPPVNQLCLNSNFDNYMARGCPVISKCKIPENG